MSFNYLFSNLYAITIINHDKNNRYRDMILSGNNNYEDICFNCNIDMNSVNYEEEFNMFINNYNLNKSLEVKKIFKKKFKKFEREK